MTNYNCVMHPNYVEDVRALVNTLKSHLILSISVVHEINEDWLSSNRWHFYDMSPFTATEITLGHIKQTCPHVYDNPLALNIILIIIRQVGQYS